MARTPRDSRIETINARTKLATRPEPYWRALSEGIFLGYRKSRGGSAWILRQRQGGAYVERRIATPDDHMPADADVVLTYGQAVDRARGVITEQMQPAPRHHGAGPTLSDIFEAYLDARTTQPGGRQNRVMSAYNAKLARRNWDRYARGMIGREPVAHLSAEKLKVWHAGIVQQPPTKRGKLMPYDPADPAQLRARRQTANRQLTNLKAALSWARGADRLPHNMPEFWRRVPPYQLGDDPTPRMLTSDEIKRLLKAAEPDLRDLLIGALMCGARYGDLARLTVADYDAENGIIRIEQGKTGKILWQPLTVEGGSLFDRLTAGRAPSDLIFVRANGTRWAQSDHLRSMHDAAVCARVEDASFKTTRATYGKLLLLATRDLELVAKALGHSDSRITRKHYAQLLPSEVAAGVRKLPALGIADNEGKVPQQKERRDDKNA